MPCYEAMMPWELQDELQGAVCRNDLHAVRDVVDRLSSNCLDHLNADGRTPLFNACRLGHLEAARILLARGADHSVADDSGETPLTAACFHGHTDVLSLLCGAGADPTVCGGNGSPPYHRALQGGQPLAAAAVRACELAWRGRLVVQAEAKRRALAAKGEEAKRQALRKMFVDGLRVAQRLQAARELEELMPAAASADGDDDGGGGGASEVSGGGGGGGGIRFSKAALAAVPPAPPAGGAAAAVAVARWNDETASQPSQAPLPSSSSASSAASSSGSVAPAAVPAAAAAPVRPLYAGEQDDDLPPGAPTPPPDAVTLPTTIQQATPTTPTPPPPQKSVAAATAPKVNTAAAREAQARSAYQILCAAAHRGELSTCQRLAAYTPLDPADTGDSHTPLVWAVVGGRLPVVEWLLAEGADPRRRDGCGYTAMFHAVQHAKDDVVRLLAASDRLLVHSLDNEGHNLVQWAAFSGSTSTLRLLVEGLGAKVDVLDRDGRSALHWAAQQGNIEAVQYLLPRSPLALPFHKDANGLTAEDQARVAAHLKTAGVIKTHCLTLALPARNM